MHPVAATAFVQPAVAALPVAATAVDLAAALAVTTAPPAVLGQGPSVLQGSGDLNSR